MNKNTAAEIRAEGFSHTQFGLNTVGEFDTAIDILLGEVTLIVKRRATAANYASADEDIANSVKRAERFLACAELCRRRIIMLESSAASSNQKDEMAAIIEKLARTKLSFEADAERELAALPAATAAPVESSSAPAFGAVVSSHFQ